MSNNDNSEIVSIKEGTYTSEQFDFINDKLRQHVKSAYVEIDNVKEKVNELVTIVHNDNKDWSLKKICAYIAGRNQDLQDFGFSARTIHNYLDEQNRQLVDKRQQRKPDHQPSESLEELRKSKGTIVQNNVMEQSGESLHPNVLEHSSIDDDNEEDEQEQQQDVLIDPNLLNEKIKEIAQKDERIQELEDTLQIIKKEKVESSMTKSFTFDYDLEIRDQILPLQVTCYPDKKTGYVRLNKNPPPTKKR